MAYTKVNSLKSKASALTSLSSIYTNFKRPISQSASLLRNQQQRVNVREFENSMEKEKKTREVLKLVDVILAQPNSMISLCRLDVLAGRYGFKLYKADSFIQKFPHFFEIFEHPVHKTRFCRLSSEAREQIEQENQALLAQVPDAITRLRKLLMLSRTGKLRLDHVRLSRKEFGLPVDFEHSVILKNPHFFRLLEDEQSRGKYIEIVKREPDLARCAIDNVRDKKVKEKDADLEKVRFSFILKFPPGLKVYDDLSEWQRLSYNSPYEDVTQNGLSLPESQNKMVKRAVAIVHELLSLTVEKRLIVERITHLRASIDLPKKLKEFLVQHQGIFYITSKGSHGKLHTFFLKEAYMDGKLIEPNDLSLARNKLNEFILYPKKAKVDKTFNTDRIYGEDHVIEDAMWQCMGNESDNFVPELSVKQDGDLHSHSDPYGADNVNHILSEKKLIQ